MKREIRSVELGTRHRHWATSAAVLVSLMLMPLATYGQDNYWIGNSGWWDNILNWSLNEQPDGGDDVHLTQSDGIDREVYYRTSADPSPLLGSLSIDATNSGTITFLQDSYSLSATNEHIGTSGIGTFTQSGGTNTITDSLNVGLDAGSTGTYNLGGSADLSVSWERIGRSGTGTFTQMGGAHTIANWLYVGTQADGMGTYNLIGGDLSAGIEVVGNHGTGAVTQTGGTNTNNWLWMGRQVGGDGTYNLSGTGELYVGNEIVGGKSMGTFNQTGGIHDTTHGFTLGYDPSGSGTYNLSEGNLSAGGETIGREGSGTFTQTGGTNIITNRLTLGGRSGSTGTYDLSGTGALSATNEHIGNLGTGTFTQTGGTNTIGSWLYVGGEGGTGLGLYSLSGTGVLSAGYEAIQSAENATFNQTGGTNTTTGALYVGSNWNGTYNLSGGDLSASWEHIGGWDGSTGTLTQTGGTNTVTSFGLTVGQNSGSTGTYNLSGTGILSASDETIGNLGSGTFTQTGGTNTTDTLTIKADSTGSGVYNLDGGILNATTIVNNDQFNYSDGTLNSDFMNNVGATFTLSGMGIRTVNGDVTNDGTVKVTGATEGTTAVFAGTFVNNGVLDTDPARLEFFGDFTIGPDGSILASVGDQYVLHQDFLINSLSTAGWTTGGADLIFTGPGTHMFSFGDLDLAWNELSLEGGATLEFNATGIFYADILSGWNVNSNGIIENIFAPSGFTLFYDPALNPGLSGAYEFSGGGSLNPVPVPGAVLLGILGLSVAGVKLRKHA